MHQMGNSTRQFQGKTHTGQRWREQTGVRAPFICHTRITSSPSLSLSNLELSDTTIYEPYTQPLFVEGTLTHPRDRFRAKNEQFKTFYGLLPESQGRNRAWTVLYVPSSLDSGCLD